MGGPRPRLRKGRPLTAWDVTVRDDTGRERTYEVYGPHTAHTVAVGEQRWLRDTESIVSITEREDRP